MLELSASALPSPVSRNIRSGRVRLVGAIGRQASGHSSSGSARSGAAGLLAAG